MAFPRYSAGFDRLLETHYAGEAAEIAVIVEDYAARILKQIFETNRKGWCRECSAGANRISLGS